MRLQEKENVDIYCKFTDDWGGMVLRIFWVLPKSLILHGHCAPRSASSCEILILCPMSHDSGQVLSFLIQ